MAAAWWSGRHRADTTPTAPRPPTGASRADVQLMYSSAPAATGRRAISTTLLPHPRSACHLPTPYDCTAPAACRAPQQQRTKMKGLPWEVPCTGNLFCHYNYMPHKKSSVHRDSARIDHPKTASGPESSFSDVSLTRQAQTNRYSTTGAFPRKPLDRFLVAQDSGSFPRGGSQRYLC
jgi:hypothetical protein